MRNILFAVFCILFFSKSIQAQKIDAHQILLFDLEGDGNALSITDPKLLTGFNLNGYNNQPCFFSEQELWLTSQSSSDTTQTEIVALDLAQKRKTAVTRTQLSEYSPTPIPNGKDWSAIVVEADGTQRLWAFPRSGGGTGRVVLPDIKGVGYHVWMSETDLALFIVGEPHTLVYTNTKNQRRKQLASNIGRCLLKHPTNGKLYFVVKPTDQTWFIKTYDPITDKQEIICQTLPKSEDFALLPNGDILMAQDHKLYLRAPETWVQIADLSDLGVVKITRLAVRDGKIALVFTSN
jgi:hypothetical protein